MLDEQPIKTTSNNLLTFLSQDSYWNNRVLYEDEVRNDFRITYKPSYKADNPGKTMANFSVILWDLKRRRLVKVSKDNDGRKVLMITNQNDGGRQKTPSSERENEDSNKRRSRRGRRGGRTRARAVDQYLNVPRGVINDRNATNTNQSNDGTATPLPQGIATTSSGPVCTLCNAKLMCAGNLAHHLKGKRHRSQLLLNAIRNNKKSLMENKDISITCANDGESGYIRFDDLKPKTPYTTKIVIKNISEEPKDIDFLEYEFLKQNRTFQLKDKHNVYKSKNTVLLLPEESYNIELSILSNQVNRYHTCIAFTFEYNKSLIHVVRYISAACTVPEVKQFSATAPFQQPPRVVLRNPQTQVEEGYMPPSAGESRLEREEPLKPYYVPNSLRHLVNTGFKESACQNEDDHEILEKTKKILASFPSALTHRELFEHLLYIEEIQMDVDIRKYDMSDAKMKRPTPHSRLLALKVPGLAENRPSVLKGDHLFAKIKGDGTSIEYKGYVHDVQMEELHLGFSQKLMEKFIDGMKFEVRFTFNRLPLRLMHRAVELAEEHSLDTLLFPTPLKACQKGVVQPLDTRMIPYDRSLNEEQVLAVRHIVCGTSRPAPYILFGPPGTGKTVTMVEAMKQVIKCIPSARILACAPSNSAADLICSRLLKHLDKRQVFRMCAMSRKIKDVPEDIRECCNYDPTKEQYFYPPKKELIEYRVIVTTLVTSGRIATANFPAGHFSHVFLDESGHAMEPEAIIALAGILEQEVCSADGGQVVFAGDPKQLGPVLRSPISIRCGLRQSLLGRLMESCKLYARRGENEDSDSEEDDSEDTYDPRLITKLVKNYRSDRVILKKPNELFYHGELECHADPLESRSLCNWDGLPTKNFPIVFHGIIGKDQREEKSPSFFNPEECYLVIEKIKDLLAARGRTRVTANQIGVISPYRKQVEKLKSYLRKENPQIKVGSVEEFQGQERRIIIISTVRSSEDFLKMDIEYKLGFLKNEKRFNVAVTRAKALLIIIGNPHVLRKDSHWNEMLTYCIENGAYTGCELNPSTVQGHEEEEEEGDYEEILKAMSYLKLDTTFRPDVVDVSAVTHQEEPEWRRGED